MVTSTYDKRLDRLLAIAAKVFAAKGYHSTTMRELARETEMSLAGMYHYVSGKDELLYLIQQRCFIDVLDGAEAALASVSYPQERLECFILHHVTFFARHMSEMKVLSHEAQSLTGHRLEAINALKRTYVSLLTKLISDVHNLAESDVAENVAAYALFGMMNWIYTWYDPTGSVSPKALAEQFTRLFLNGLTAPTPSPASPGG